jgi:hypothetical protein
MHFHADWRRLIRLLTQYVAPGLVTLVLIIEITGGVLGATLPAALTTAYKNLVLVVFSLLTLVMIGVCGWIVFLWDLDRLFFTLEGKIDLQVAEWEAKSDGVEDRTVLGRAWDMFNTPLQNMRAKAVVAIESSYWHDINAGAVLAFPQPNIAAAVEQIEKSRRDLLAPLTEIVSTAIPLGSVPASIVSRFVFRYVAPEIKRRLYRRLVLRFLSQLGALFALTAVCFFISVLAWSRVDVSVFEQTSVSSVSIMLYQLDLILRGALFDVMEHTHRSVSPITVNQKATLFVYYTLLFRMFVAVYVISSVFRVVRFMLRGWRAVLR